MSEDSEHLWDAIEAKDWEELKHLIRLGYQEDFEGMDYDDWGYIFEVIWAGKEELACFWLDHGYRPEAVGGKDRMGIIHAAAAHNMPRLIEKVLAKSSWVSVDEWDYDRNTPLWYASKYGNEDCVKTLLKAGANPDGFNLEENPNPWPHIDSPLCVAPNAKIARLLLEAGASLEITPHAGVYVPRELDNYYELADEYLSPLTIAAMYGRMDVARELLDWGAILNAQVLRFMAFGEEGCGAENLLEIIREGADPNGEPGKEPLRIAARLGNTEICRVLLEAGAKPIPDALNLAIKSGKAVCAQLFLEMLIGDPSVGIRLAAKRGNGILLHYMLDHYPDLIGYALHGAIEGCHFSLARQILKKGADTDCRDENGKTPLMTLFSIDRRKDTYRFMQNEPEKYKGDWQYRHEGWQPRDEDFESKDLFDFNLHRPRNWNDLLELVEEDVMLFSQELMDLGADIHAKDVQGCSILWYACSKSWLKSIPWLAGMGIDINERDNNGDSAFDAGCLSGESFTVKPMLQAGADIDSQDCNGNTALFKCFKRCQEDKRSGCWSTISYLIREGADPDHKNQEGESPRIFASKDKSLMDSLKWAERWAKED